MNTKIESKENITYIKANSYIILSGILYGFLGFLGTHILSNKISIADMLFWRFFIAGCWIFIFNAIRNQKFSAILKINKNVIFFMLTLGAIGYAGSSGFYFMASHYTGTGLAMVIFFSYPIFILLYNWLIQGNKLNFSSLLTIAALIVGLYLLQLQNKNAAHLQGIFFAVLSAISYAAYVLGSKKFSALKLDATVLTLIVCISCATIFLIITLLQHGFYLPHTVHKWIYLFALGILATAIPIQLMLEGLKYISSMRASLLSVLEPLVTLLVGVLWMHETVNYLQLLGVAIILFGTLLIPFQKERI